MIEKHKQDHLRTSHQYLTEEDDSLDDKDWSYINDILKNSGYGEKTSHEASDYPRLQSLTPEGALERAPASRGTSTKFNQKFNRKCYQNLTFYEHKERDAVALQTWRRIIQLHWRTTFQTEKGITWQTLTKLKKVQTKKTPGANLVQPISVSNQSQELTTRRRKKRAQSDLRHHKQTRTQFLKMATVHSSRACLPKFCCSILVISLFTAGLLLTGVYLHPNFNNHGAQQRNQTNSSTETIIQTTTGNDTLTAERIAFIQASN
jgi:hypothetical protein